MAVRDDLGDLFTPIFDRMTLKEYEEYDLVCEQVFDVITDDSKEWKSSDVSLLGMWDETPERQGVSHEDMVQGFDQTLTHTTYTKGFTVSWEAFDDDEYAVISKEKDAKAMGRGARARKETVTSDHLNNAFSGTYLGPDNKALCANDHPTSTADSTSLDNQLTSAILEHDGLETMEIQIVANLQDEKGIKIELPREALLVVPFANYGPAQRIIAQRAGEKPDTPERAINIYARNREGWINYLVTPWQYISTATYWFVIFPSLNKIKGLKLVNRQKPEYFHYIDHKTRSYVWDGQMRFSSGWDDWRPVWGATGA